MVDTVPTRLYPRVKLQSGMFVGWQCGSRRFVSPLEDIALGGIFIRTPNPPPPESLIKIIVQLPTGDVEARGVVRRIAPNRGMGIKFTAMSPDDRGRLSGLLKPLLEKQQRESDPQS